MIEDNNRIKFSFSVEDLYTGEKTTLDKEVERDYLDNSELATYLELYKQFLYTCGFNYVGSDQALVILNNDELDRLGEITEKEHGEIFMY